MGRRHRTVRGGAAGRSWPARVPQPALFLPYLGGERTPHNDGTIRGAFAGLSHDTDRRLLTQAVLEGVAFSLRDCLDALAASGTRIEAADVIGGGSRSPVWIAIIASVLGIPLSRLAAGENGGAFGAARLARMAVTGEARTPCACRRSAPRPLLPDPGLTAAYAARLVIYSGLEHKHCRAWCGRAEMKLRDKVAVVTGAGRGIGRAICARYIAEGAFVFVTDIDEARARNVAPNWVCGRRRAAGCVQPGRIDGMIAAVVAQRGRLDILVNNAGIFDLAPIVEITRESYHRVFAVNVEGVLFTLQAAAGQMIAQGGGGKIINFASQAGRRARRWWRSTARQRPL